MRREVSPVMTGTFGVDVQATRCVISLREGSALTARARAVGDGRRRFVPNALGPGGLWGSRAAEALTTVLPDDPGAPPSAPPSDWRADPWTTEFFRGLHDRLYAYLGSMAPTHRHGYDVCVCLEDGGGRPDPDRLRQLCRDAGLTESTTVRPTDALVCRWLTETAETAASESWTGRVVAIAGGEAWTAVMAYQIDRPEGRAPRAARIEGQARLMDRGSGGWVSAMAGMIVKRCRENAPPMHDLGVQDGVMEFGARLRGGSRDQKVEWTGAMADRMFDPLRLTREDCAAWDEVTRVTGGLPSMVTASLGGAHRERGPDLVLIGGVAAIWPFIADAVSACGPVWRSSAPGEDLAAGAAWWPVFRDLFTSASSSAIPAGRGSALFPDASTTAHAGAPAPRGDDRPMSEAIAGPDAERDELPPWKRLG